MKLILSSCDFGNPTSARFIKNNAEDDHVVILGIILIRIIMVKNKSELISIYETVRICYVW